MNDWFYPSQERPEQMLRSFHMFAGDLLGMACR